MRSTLTISLTPEMMAFVKKEAKNRHFPNVSEFMRYLIRSYHEETQLKLQLMKSKIAISEGHYGILGKSWGMRKDQKTFKEETDANHLQS